MQSSSTLSIIDAPEPSSNRDQLLVNDNDNVATDQTADASADSSSVDEATSEYATADPEGSEAEDDSAPNVSVSTDEPSDGDLSVTSTNSAVETAVPIDVQDHDVYSHSPDAVPQQSDTAANISPEPAGYVSAEQPGSATTADAPAPPTLPDPSDISARLKNLVVAVSQVEELSRRAREVAASDMALYDGIAASQRQFEAGLAEARRIAQEARAVYERAFGREARALAEPAVTEAREVEQAFEDLASAWREQAENFLGEHPDVESLLAEQRQQSAEARRREVARAKAERFQHLVTTMDDALRQGLLTEARDCLNMLGREFPAEASRVEPLRERLEHRVRQANDDAARRVLFQASELQGRGDFDAAVRLLEAVEVNGLSRETSEDVFGRWSNACSLLGQTGDLELLRSSSTQGRGIILHRDPEVPYGLVVFSALGMGRAYSQGRIVSAADEEGKAIIARARPFRAADLPSEFNTGWYGRSYVTSGAAGAPVRH